MAHRERGPRERDLRLIDEEEREPGDGVRRVVNGGLVDELGAEEAREDPRVTWTSPSILIPSGGGSLLWLFGDESTTSSGDEQGRAAGGPGRGVSWPRRWGVGGRLGQRWGS